MKLNKFVILLGVVVVAGLAFIMSSEKASEKVVGVADDKKTKVGFVYLTTPGDHGWTYRHDIGGQQVEEAYGDKVKTIYVENVKYGPDAERVMRNLAEEGADIIFATSFGYMEQMLKVAKDYPHVKFEHATGYKQSENMASY